MQSHDCAKYLRICANFGLMNAKQENWHQIHVFVKLDKVFLVSHVFMSFLMHVSAQNCQSEQFECAEKFTFRQSVYIITFIKMERRIPPLGSVLNICLPALAFDLDISVPVFVTTIGLNCDIEEVYCA